jgi:hypothetical protein
MQAQGEGVDFTGNLREMLWARVGEKRDFVNRKRMADALGIDPSQLNRFMDGERGLSVESLGRVLDGLGARVVLPGAESHSVREGGFVAPGPIKSAFDAAPPAAEDYVAVPSVLGAVAAAPGLILPSDIHGWVLVWRHHESVRFRSDLAAVRIEEGELSMAPMLLPGDTVLVDRAEKSLEPAGRIMLVREPEGVCSIKRVVARSVDGDTELVFYSETPREHPPRVYRLNRDYGGEIVEAIGGRVIWAWNDMTRK